MIFDLNATTGREFDAPDVCIIGSGAAGIVLALELHRLGKRVLMLEGGGREIEEQEQDAYRSEVIGLRHNGINNGRFRSYGGTTKKWGGQILELDAIDFETRPWINGSGWPFQKTELLPYYYRSLELQGAAGSVPNDADVWRALHQPAPQLGDQLISYFTRWCNEPDFTRLHGEFFEKNTSVALYLHANATTLQMSEDGSSIAGVLCKSSGGRQATFTAKQYVLCMGAIETSRFLLQPTQLSPGEWRGTLWNSSGLLGRHFQDHIDCNAAWINVQDSRRIHDYFDNVYLHGFKYHPKLKLSPAMQRQLRVLNIGSSLFFQCDFDQAFADTRVVAAHVLKGRWDQISPMQLARTLWQTPLLLRQIARYKFHHRAYNPSSSDIALRVHCEQEPLGASSITLGTERDQYGLLRARIDWRVSTLERETISNYIHLVKDAFSAAGLAEVVIDSSLSEADDSFYSITDDSNHHMGGARMSVSAADGVVNQDLRLHASTNGYVCSGAVFPTSGFSNPTHTILALAVRLANHLAGAPITAVSV